MPHTLSSDVEFFSAVHGMRREARLWAQQGRSADRHTFACRQWVAFYDDGDDENERTFREVECHDLSTGGFSFLTPEVPEADRLCVRLGSPDRYVYLTAQMVHCLAVDTDGGAPGFIIGCRFLGRTSDVRSAVIEPATA
jgi:hypothetical protein